MGPLFRSAWSPVWKLFLDASAKDLQVALRTCGLGPEQEAVLLDSMHAGAMHANLNLPEMHKMTTQQERDSLSKSFTMAMQAWKDHSWSGFGAQLGSILRDMIVLTFPQKWSVDDAGRLRNMLQMTETRSVSDAASSLSQHLASTGAGMFFCAVAALLVFGALTLSLRRTQHVQVALLNTDA